MTSQLYSETLSKLTVKVEKSGLCFIMTLQVTITNCHSHIITYSCDMIEESRRF